MQTRTFTAIVNPTAGGPGGSGVSSLLPLARLLREAGAEVTVEYSRDLEHAGAVAREAAARGDVVLGVGGDGMAGRVGGAVARNGGVFGIVPAGRGNDFARQLGLPAETEKLAELLLTGEPKPVDVIEVGGNERRNDGHHRDGPGARHKESTDGTIVLGSVYAGVDAVANRNANQTRLLRGSPAYYVGALRAVATWRPASYRVTVDGGVYERRGYTVVAANSGFYGFGRHIAPDARVDDGLLDIVFIKHAPKPLFFAVMRELADGSHVRRPEVEVVRGREVRIEADRDLPYGADGELIGTVPVTARVLPGALRVLCT